MWTRYLIGKRQNGILYGILREFSSRGCNAHHLNRAIRHLRRETTYAALASIIAIVFTLQIVYLAQFAECEAWRLPASVGWPMAYWARSPARYRCNWAISVLDFGSAVIGRAADAHRWNTYLRCRWETFDSLERSAEMVYSSLHRVHGTRGVLGSSWRRTIEDHRRVRSPEEKQGM